MKTLLTGLAISLCAWGAIGDNAPSIPAGYVSAHPRLGSPANTYLQSVWDNRAGGAKYIFDNATAWNPSNSYGGGATLATSNCRYLLIAYLASRVGGSPDSTYLTKIKSLASLQADWDISAGNSYWQPGICTALAYDWIYSDLDSTARAGMLANMDTMMSGFEANYVSAGSSPINDQFYLTGVKQIPFLMLALVSYPDNGSTSLAHLRWSMDVWFNLVMPSWKRVMTGGMCQNASTDNDINCGAGWHEAWPSYFAQVGQPSQNQWYVMVNLAWKNATGDDIFTREGWLKNIAYWTMYLMRPDMLLVKANGAYTQGYLTSEYDGSTYNSAFRPGLLTELGKIYNDPTIRAWARKVNWRDNTPSAYEPSGWPWLDPDTSSATNTRSVLSKVRNFPGWGTVFFRTGWGEDDTLVTLEYGDNFWSHPMYGVGSFTIYNRGQLVLNSGNYKPGSASEHFKAWTTQTIAHNTILVNNPSESYPAENQFVYDHSDGSETTGTLPNDGGQVRQGSEYSISNGSSRIGPTSPSGPGDMDRSREWWHRSKLVGYAVGSGNKYSVAIIDMTAAYNNMFSRVPHQDYNKYTANTANRSFRVRKAVRYLVFIPRGTAAYVVTYDQVISTDPTYTKTWLLHSVNQPTIGGNSYTVTRNETVTDRYGPANGWQKYRTDITHCPAPGCTASNSQYIYDGKLYGWMTNPTGGSLNTIGGTGNEFFYAGKNWNECMNGQCPANQGTGDTTGIIKSVATDMPYEPGGWRLEETMDAARLSDQVVNVMLATNTGDTNTVSTAPATSVSGSNLVTVWKDNSNSCTYTLTLPQDGIGGHLSIAGTCSGSQAVDADLLSTQPGMSIPANTWTKVNSTGEIIGYVTGNVDECEYVPAITSLACLDSYRATSSEPNLNWMLYNLDENKVSIANDISKFQSSYWTEGGHPIGIGVDPTNSVGYGYMAHSGGQVSDMSKTTVSFDFLARIGKNKRTATVPQYNANQMHCTFQTFERKLVCWGGDSASTALSKYDPSANTWSINVATTGSCPQVGLQVPMIALNTLDKRLYLFGGRFGGILHNELFSIDTNQSPAVCTQITPTGGPPAARIWGGWDYDQARNLFVLVGGSTTGIAGGGNIYDTWIFDPVAKTWTDVTATVGTPGTPPAPPEYRFHYAPELDAFVLLPQGQVTNQPTFFYYLRLAPGANVGGLSLAHSETTGGFNHDAGKWASNGWVAADVSHVYAGFTQYGPGSVGGNQAFLHPYVQDITTGTATNIPPGASYQSLSPDSGSAPLESVDISMAMVAGVPWACWSEQGNAILARMQCKGYSGGNWSLGGNIGSTSYPGQSQIIDIGGKPTVVFRHNDRTILSLPLSVMARVRQFDGSSWTELGNGLNANTGGSSLSTVALSVSIASDGTTNPYVAWSEYTGANSGNPPSINYTNTKVYLKKWDGANWNLQCGGPANTNTSSGWAEYVSVAYYNGDPYVAFTERVAVSGAPRLFVRKCSGGVWSTVGGGYRNRDQVNGWVFQPKLFVRGSNLDLVWDEQGNEIPWEGNLSYEGAYAEPVKIYTAEWDGTNWRYFGGALNADTAYGTATMPSIAASGVSLVALWGEHKPGAARTMYAKRWNGTDWAPMGAGGGGGGGIAPSITTNSLPAAPRGLAYSQTLTASGDTPITWSVTSGSLPAGLSLNSSTGAITGIATTLGTSNFTVQATNASGSNTQSLSVSVRNPNVPTDYATFQAGLTGIASIGCGNTLTVNAGVYTENITVPASNCTLANPIRVQFNGAIPPAGVRITPNYLPDRGTNSPAIPLLRGAVAGSVMKFTFGDTPSKGWVFSGIGVDCNLGAPNQICIDVGTQDWAAFSASMAAPVNATSANLPSNIAFDHCILRGSRLGQARVGMELNGQSLRVVDSWLGDLWDAGASDGQAIRSLSGDGPVDIVNTYLDGQTETLGVGGTGSIITTPSTIYGPFVSFTTAGSIPSNVTVDQSHLTHGLWLRYDGMNGFTWSPGQLVRMGQVWIAYSNNNPQQTRTGVYQAQGMGTTGSAFPTNICTTNGCSFTDGTVTWKAICNFSGGETYIGSGIAKNLAECKQCGAWTIKRSFLQHAWEGGGGGGAQGFALTFSHRSNVAPYSVMGPITFKDNIIDDVAGVLQASAFGDDADSNIYPTVRSSLAGPYTITSGNNTLVVDGTTVTLTTGTRTAAQIAEEINAALPHLTVSSVSAPIDNQPYWTKYTLTLSGNVSYAMSYDAAPILASVRNGITRTDLGQSGDNQAVQIWCTWDSTYGGGSGRTICDGIGQNQVEFLYPYGARISASPGATISMPTVASSYHDASTNGDYLVIVKGQYFASLPISGPAADSIGLPSGATLYCTHPITRKWYGCGVSKGVMFTNNLVTNASTDSNKFAVFRSPYLIWPSNIHPLEISHNTFDYQYGPAFLGQGTPNSGAIRNNIALFRSAASSGETSYFSDGRQAGLSWIQSYLCAAPLDGTNIGTYSWMGGGSVLPDCQPGVASGNVLPGSTPYTAEVLPAGSTLGSSSAVPKSTINASVANVVFRPGSYKLASAGTPYLPPGSYNVFGVETANGYSGGALELGTKFKADVDGQVTKLRYFHPANCPAETRTGSLWTVGGAQLATGSFPAGTPGTWVEMTLPVPVNITAGTTYVVSYHTGSCYAINMEDLSQPYGKFPLHVVNPGSVFSGGGFPTIGDTMGHAADVVFVATGTIATGTNGTIGSGQAQTGDYTDTGVDTSKLSLIRNLQVTYSDRAAIVSWLDSEVSQNIPGVLRLCQNDPEYDPTCTPAGSISGADPVTGALADNSDNDNSPKNGLQRYIVVTGLIANTKYYAQLYRGGHYRTFSFITLPSLTGSASVPVSRAATSRMGAVATMQTAYGATYRRSSGVITGGAISTACSAGSSCSGAATAPLGDPLYVQSQMQNSAGAVLYSYPVSVTIPGAATLLP